MNENRILQNEILHISLDDKEFGIDMAEHVGTWVELTLTIGVTEEESKSIWRDIVEVFNENTKGDEIREILTKHNVLWI